MNVRPFFRRPLPCAGWCMRPAARPAMPRLQQAHSWMAQGEHLQTAAAFVALGEQAQAHGLQAEAAALQSEVFALAPGIDLSSTAGGQTPGRKPRQAAKCPTGTGTECPTGTGTECPTGTGTECPCCGGTIHPETVEWINESSATCRYCGSVLQAEAQCP